MPSLEYFSPSRPRDNKFLVGLSIDGPRELHDRYRVNRAGAPTFDKVMVAANLLRKHGVRFNTLTCVHRGNASRPLDVHRFLRRELDSTAIQFVPIVNRRISRLPRLMRATKCVCRSWTAPKRVPVIRALSILLTTQ